MTAEHGRAISLKAQKISKIMDSKIIFWSRAASPPSSSNCTSSFPSEAFHKKSSLYLLYYRVGVLGQIEISRCGSPISRKSQIRAIIRGFCFTAILKQSQSAAQSENALSAQLQIVFGHRGLEPKKRHYETDFLFRYRKSPFRVECILIFAKLSNPSLTFLYFEDECCFESIFPRCGDSASGFGGTAGTLGKGSCPGPKGAGVAF
jgi:hypothetical protein